jgi:hypothetical protein
VHALPSLQAVPFATAGLLQFPVVVLHTSCVQVLPSLQFLAAPVHAPAWQVSFSVHALPSVHAVPFATAVFVQLPEVESHASAVQVLLSLQFLAAPAAQTPDWHVSLSVHALPSEHTVPFVIATFAQTPVVVLQASVVHVLPSLQSFAVPAVQVPDLHVSLIVQAFPSVQVVPSADAGLEQLPVAGSHRSSVHGFVSAQFLAVPPAQTPTASHFSVPRMHRLAVSQLVSGIRLKVAHCVALNMLQAAKVQFLSPAAARPKVQGVAAAAQVPAVQVPPHVLPAVLGRQAVPSVAFPATQAPEAQ